MRNSKLIQLMETLNEDEIRGFTKYVIRINKDDSNIVKIFNYLKKNRTFSDEKKLDRKYIFTKLFDNEGFNERKILDLASDLSLQLEEYLLLRFVKTSILHKNYLLTEIYKRRGLEKLALQINRKSIKNLPEKYDLTYHLNAWRLLHNQFNLGDSTEIKKGRHDELLDKINTHLDMFFMLTKMRYYTEVKNREFFINKKTEALFMNEIIEYSEKKPFSENPLFEIYKGISQLNDHPDETTYEYVKALFYQCKNKLSENEIEDIFLFLINYANTIIIRGNLAYQEELLKLYQEGFVQNMVSEYGAAFTQHYINAVILAAELNQVEWAENFICNYSSKLKEKNQQDVSLLAKAYLLHVKSDYEKSLEKINSVNFHDISYEFISRTLIIRNYYEVPDDRYPLMSRCDTFERFLMDNKFIGKKLKESNLNFVRLVKKLKRAKNKPKALKNLHDEISEKENLVCRKWLLKKVNELM